MMKCLVLLSLLLPTLAKEIKFKVDVPCGEPVVAPYIARAFGGAMSRPWSWPWLVLIVDNYRYIVGTGTILHPHVILTTAQHFEQKGFELGKHDLRNYKLYAGDYNITVKDPGEEIYHFARVVIHPGYNVTTLENDLALVLTQEPVTYNKHTRPICLPDGKHPNKPGQVCFRAGWGSTAHRGKQKTLFQTDVPVLPDEVCAGIWSDFLPDTEVCAGYRSMPKLFCPDDIGGPLMCQYKPGGPWHVQGIASSGTDCNKPYVPGVYEDAHLYLHWIKNTMNDAGYSYQY